MAAIKLSCKKIFLFAGLFCGVLLGAGCSLKALTSLLIGQFLETCEHCVTTLGKTTLNITTFSITIKNDTLSLWTLDVIAVMSVVNKPISLSVVMLSGVILSAVAPCTMQEAHLSLSELCC